MKFGISSANNTYYHEIQVNHSLINIVLQNAIEVMAEYAKKKSQLCTNSSTMSSLAIH